MTEQVHGVEVHRVESASRWPLAAEADVLVTRGKPSGIWAGDCAPIFLIGASGTIVGAHGGWRGLAAGVIDVAVDQLLTIDEPVATALVGPLIHPCCYEFGAADVAEVAAGVHAAPAAVTGTTVDGRTGLDVPAAVRAGLAAHDIELESVGPCTGCSDRWFSNRVRQDSGRHAVIAWSERRSERRSEGRE
jgi:copper oxidase (laccase) domain-containing protein